MSSFEALKRLLLGRQLATAEEQHERLSKKFARPPFRSVTVIIPEFVVEHWYEELLHNQDASRFKAASLERACAR